MIQMNPNLEGHMTAILSPSPDRVILNHISWQTYQSLIIDFESEPAVRLTYDRGTLEIRMPLAPHETAKKILGRLIEAATEELDLEIRSLGSLTCNRQDLAKGLEPDQCYYIQHEPQVRGVASIDLGQRPPPDLAVEIDITSSSLNRFVIYADLGVPEIWRYDGRSLTMYHLEDGEYLAIDRSVAIPALGTADICQFLGLSATMGENSLVKEFRQWLQSL
jgi:Uma2 family endonuclease